MPLSTTDTTIPLPVTLLPLCIGISLVDPKTTFFDLSIGFQSFLDHLRFDIQYHV